MPFDGKGMIFTTMFPNHVIAVTAKPDRRVWFLFEASRHGEPGGH